MLTVLVERFTGKRDVAMLLKVPVNTITYISLISVRICITRPVFLLHMWLENAHNKEKIPLAVAADEITHLYFLLLILIYLSHTDP